MLGVQGQIRGGGGGVLVPIHRVEVTLVRATTLEVDRLHILTPIFDKTFFWGLMGNSSLLCNAKNCTLYLCVIITYMFILLYFSRIFATASDEFGLFATIPVPAPCHPSWPQAALWKSDLGLPHYRQDNSVFTD